MRNFMLLCLLSVWIIPQIDYRVYLDMFPNIRELARCESGISAKAFNPNDTDGRAKFGLLQYGKSEFYSWADKAGIDDASIWNPLHQIVVYRWAEENGLAYRWGCQKILKNKGLSLNL